CGSSFLLFASPSTGGPNGGPPALKEYNMPTGTVKFFNESKGFGFIQPDDGGHDAFVHISAVEQAGLRTLNKDQKVTYDLEQDNRGKTKAANLQSTYAHDFGRRARRRRPLSSARERVNEGLRPLLAARRRGPRGRRR